MDYTGLTDEELRGRVESARERNRENKRVFVSGVQSLPDMISPPEGLEFYVTLDHETIKRIFGDDISLLDKVGKLRELRDQIGRDTATISGVSYELARRGIPLQEGDML